MSLTFTLFFAQSLYFAGQKQKALGQGSEKQESVNQIVKILDHPHVLNGRFNALLVLLLSFGRLLTVHKKTCKEVSK